MYEMTKVSTSTTSWTMIEPAGNNSVVFRVDKFGAFTLFLGFSFLVHPVELCYHGLDQSDCIVMAHSASSTLL